MKPDANQPGTAQLVEIGKPVYGGAFLARLEGKAVFVPLALPGEQARVRLTQSKPGYATAELEEIVASAPERVAPGCAYFGVCGGCDYQHTGYENQLALKQAILRETLERGGVTAPEELRVLAAKPWGYRNRIRLAFDAAGNPGYRGRRSHAVTAVSECPIAAPLLATAAQAAAELMRQFCVALKPSEIALFCDARETELLVSVVCANTATKGFKEFAAALQERVAALKGAALLVEGQAGRKGPVQPPRIVAEWGAGSLRYGAAGFDYRVDQGAFFQVNRWLVDALVDEVTAGQHGGLAWDLFAGVGLFARRLTAQFGRVVAVESAPSATRALAENLKGTCGAPVRAATLDYLSGGRKGARGEAAAPDFVVVDPPRTGLGAETCALLAGVGAVALAYVSCDPATLARDLKLLVGAGYRIESITLADLFPQTYHLETVVHLRRD